jgi:hypothetical protein
MVSIPAVFDGTTIRLLEAPPFDTPYRVMVVFVEPVSEELASNDVDPFMASFGAWQSEPDEDDLLTVIRSGRRSSHDPPRL